jgi:hypothetical protein
MPTLDLLAVLIVLTAAFGYVNVRMYQAKATSPSLARRSSIPCR